MAIQTITYDNKVALNTNPEIADINKVTDNDMNEIKAVVNNNATETSNNTNAIVNLQTYSTSEVKTGEIWIDGKPIYRKVIQQNVSDTTEGNIPIDITGVNDIWINTSKTFFKWSSFPWTVPIFYQTSTNYLSLYINNTNIKYYGKLSNYNLTGTFYIVLEYTKTTD